MWLHGPTSVFVLPVTGLSEARPRERGKASLYIWRQEKYIRGLAGRPFYMNI